ncbi:MAG: hypothetical protein WC633_00555 [Desulfurivibrionaceae bacterium]|jgi:hypothetical protein
MIVTKKSQELRNSQSVFLPWVVAKVLSKVGWAIIGSIAQALADKQYGKITGNHNEKKKGMAGCPMGLWIFFRRGNKTTCCPMGSRLFCNIRDTQRNRNGGGPP